MRMLLKASIPVEAGNANVKSGSLGSKIESILAEQKPESAYFTLDNGMRTGFIFLDIQDASQLPAILEPWFLAFNASIELTPVMNGKTLERLARALGPPLKNTVKWVDLYSDPP